MHVFQSNLSVGIHSIESEVICSIFTLGGQNPCLENILHPKPKKVQHIKTGGRILMSFLRTRVFRPTLSVRIRFDGIRVHLPDLGFERLKSMVLPPRHKKAHQF